MIIVSCNVCSILVFNRFIHSTTLVYLDAKFQLNIALVIIYRRYPMSFLEFGFKGFNYNKSTNREIDSVHLLLF